MDVYCVDSRRERTRMGESMTTNLLQSSAFDRIRPIVEDYLKNPVAPRCRVPLSAPAYGSAEVMEAIETLLSGNLTMGKKCRQFEEMVARDLGVRTVLFANSGSSSNLLAVAALSNPWVKNHWKLGDEIITPAVTWSTTCWPIVQHGLVPVFVDVNPDTFTIDLEKLEAAISPRTRGIAIVHLLGNPVNMDKVMDIAARHNLLVFEDCCEAMGATWNGRPVGSFGDAGSFSTYFSHHITTIEGGLLTTQREDVAEATRALREHGWTRSLQTRAVWAHENPNIDERFLFANVGYNLRPTEIGASFGLHQWPKLPDIVETRLKNHYFWMNRLRKYDHLLHFIKAPLGASPFSFAASPREDAPFSRKEWASFLESVGIETRPIMTGNFLRHPAWRDLPHRVHGSLEVADFVSDQGLLWGNHQAISTETLHYVADAVDSFMDRFV